MDYQNLRDDVYFLANTTSASYATADVLRNINKSYNEITYMIWDAQDAWQFDDRTKLDLPYFRITLTNGTKDYSIPETLQKISRVEVLDSNSQWTRVNPFDNPDIESALPEYNETFGTPVRYSLRGNFISLYPPPASGQVTTVSGLALYGSRDVSEFTGLVATAVPGFAKQFHRILSYSAVIDFEEDSARLRKFVLDRENLIKGLKRFYTKRMVERSVNVRPRTKRFWRQYR